MHRTLFSPVMIETFRTCRRAYDAMFLQEEDNEIPERLAVICKQFILRALAQINKGKIISVSQIQKYLGQHWPADKVSELTLDKDETTKAFLFVYKTLLRYVIQPYLPDKAQVVGVALTIRARVPHIRVYMEETFDLVLWHPQKRQLEFVDFQLKPSKAVDPAWPSASLLVKKFLAERLETRWPFEKLVFTELQIGPGGTHPTNLQLEETTYRLHWAEVVKTLEEMKTFEMSEAKDYGIHAKGTCRPCQILDAQTSNILEMPEPNMRLLA